LALYGLTAFTVGYRLYPWVDRATTDHVDRKSPYLKAFEARFVATRATLAQQALTPRKI
jgi:hypothetical protein